MSSLPSLLLKRWQLLRPCMILSCPQVHIHITLAWFSTPLSSECKQLPFMYYHRCLLHQLHCSLSDPKRQIPLSHFMERTHIQRGWETSSERQFMKGQVKIPTQLWSSRSMILTTMPLCHREIQPWRLWDHFPGNNSCISQVSSPFLL